jgi:hypothetical protein
MGGALVEYSKQTRDELLELRSELLRQVNELQKRIQAIDVILPELSQRKEAARIDRTYPLPGDPKIQVKRIDLSLLRGMKQMPALKVIARAQGGIVRTNEAKELMVHAGVVKNSKNAYKMVYNLIKNSDEFQPTGTPGEYRLTEATPSLSQ